MSGSSEPNPDAAPSSAADRIADVVPVRGRLLGLDFGTKRVGIAVCDDEQRIASPLEIYTRSRPELDAVHLQHVAREYRVVGLVVGLPLHMGGEEGQKAREARRFGAWAASAMTLPLTFWDERLTSAVAEEYLISAQMSRKKRKTRIDKVAAQIMLQSYLESRRARR